MASSLIPGVPIGTHRADGDDVRVVARSFDGAVAFGVHGQVAAIVAGGNDDDDAGLPCLLDCLAERIESIALKDRAGPARD